MKSPLKAIRERCVWCCNGSFKEVTLCPATACPLHAYRTGHLPEGARKNVSATAAILARCRDCAGDGQGAIEHCEIPGCALYTFRPTSGTQQRGRRRRIPRQLPSCESAI
jgi:hypothetical protein